jgi:chemotaxis response regulator CheB
MYSPHHQYHMSDMDESVVSAFTVVGIGASAGGIKALKEFFRADA